MAAAASGTPTGTPIKPPKDPGKTPVKLVEIKGRTSRYCVVCDEDVITSTYYVTANRNINRRLRAIVGSSSPADQPDDPHPHSSHICRKCFTQMEKIEKNEEIFTSKYNQSRQRFLASESVDSGRRKRMTKSPGIRQKRRYSAPPAPCSAKPSRPGQEEPPAPLVARRRGTPVADVQFQVKESMSTVLDGKESMSTVLDGIRKECEVLCQKQERASVFGKTDPTSLKEWSYKSQKEELQQKAPTLYSVVRAACNIEKVEKKKEANQERKKKKIAAKERGMLSGTAVLLQTRSKFCNAHGMVTALQLKRGGSSIQTFNRLYDRKLCVSYKTALRKQNELGKNHNTEVLEWAKQVEVEDYREKMLIGQFQEISSIAGEESPEAQQKLAQIVAHQSQRHPGYKLVGDNVDLRSHARQMSTKHRDQDHHFFNHVAVKNRVSGHMLSSLNPHLDVRSIPCSSFLPDVDDNNALRSDWIVLTGHIIAKYVPALSWFDLHLPKLISHQYDDVASKKSEVINLGVLLHNENTDEGIKAIMEELHKYVPGAGTDHAVPTLSGGDLLTCEREYNVQEDRRGSEAEVRWGGLVPNIDDFHTIANFYKVVWDYLYCTSSARDVGTLYAARNKLGLSNVTIDPFKDYHASTELITRYTDSLVVCAALTYFGMTSVDGEPTVNKFDIAKEDAGSYVRNVLGNMVENYAMVTGPTSTASGMRCPHCNQTFKKISNMRKHVQSNHEAPLAPAAPHRMETRSRSSRSNTQAPSSSSSPSSQSQEDSVHNYSCTALGLCLLVRDFHDAVKRADGARVIRLYKFFMLYFKVSGKTKYAFHSMRLLVEVHHLMPPRLAHQLTWNRFINLAGNPDSNFPMDLLLEFHNKVFKEDCRGFRGKVTDDAITRVSRAAQRLDQILQGADKSGGVKQRSGAHAKQDVKEDVLELVKAQHQEDIFSCKPGWFHSAFPAFPSNPLEHLNFASLQKWMSDKLKSFSRVKLFQKL